MKLVDWNCKKCGKPLPDKLPWGIDEYIYCPDCGAKHMIDRTGETFVEPVPWPQWDDSSTVAPYKWDDCGTAGSYHCLVYIVGEPYVID